MHLKVRLVVVVLTAIVVMAFSPTLSIKGQQAGASLTVFSLSTSVQATLTRVPEEVRAWQPALIFAYVVGNYSELRLDVTVSLNAILKMDGQVIWSDSSSHDYSIAMLPVSWAFGWYVTAIPGLPAETYRREGIIYTYTLTIRTGINYTLLVDDKAVGTGNYTVLEGDDERTRPPLVLTMVYDVLNDPSILNETLGLGPKGWVAGGGEIMKTLIVAFDDKGLEDINNVTFEYRVNDGAWTPVSIQEDPMMQTINSFIGNLTNLLQQIEERAKPYIPDVDVPELLLPLMVAYAEFLGPAVGNYVMFRANATDVDGNKFTSPMGFYYVANKASPTKVLIVDPHVKLWLFQENVEQLAETFKQNVNYELPPEIIGNMTLVNKVADVVENYGVTPFHHWEYLGKQYDLYIAWPDERLVDLLKTEAEGGFEPKVIFLSNLTLGFNGTEQVGSWNWDLRDIEVDGKSVLEYVIQYVKDRNAGFIASHGTLSDWVMWLDCNPNQHYKVGARGHVGDTLGDFNPDDEKTVAALLGMPQLSLWEYGRDKVADYLCKVATDPMLKAIAMMIGSLPLQVPYVPFNGTFGLTDEGKYVGWDIPEEFTVAIPSVYNEFGFNTYTQVGWQLAMPRALAYLAWRKANETRPMAEQLYAKLSKLMENVTSRTVLHENATKFTDEALEWGLGELYRSIVNASITGSTFNVTISPPDLNQTLRLAIDIGRDAYDKLLSLLPVKLVALSNDGLSAIIVHDKYWDSNGYRSVYFGFEVEATEGEIAEKLLIQAVNWTLQWSYKDITQLLGNLVRVPKELANSFDMKFNALPGYVTYSDGIVLVEEGNTTVSVNATEAGFLHLLIAHPTSGKVNLAVVEGAEVYRLVNVTKGLTYITLEIHQAGTVKLNIKADPESSLNPAYLGVKQETDITPPSTTISLSGVVGDNGWFTSDVQVTLSAADENEVDKTEYSLDNSTWIIYTTPFTISEEGSTIVYYKSTDKTGNPETIKTKTIKIDKTLPLGSITINNGATFTTSTSVTLTLNAADATSGAYRVRFSNDGTWDTEPWETLSSTKTWQLTTGDGIKAVYYQVKDNAGLVSITYSDTIILDTVPPTGSILINDGATHTNTTTVILTLSATDATSGIAEMRFSNNNVTWSDWGAYATSKTWTLTTGDGTKTVYVQFRDQAGLISTYSDTIVLDTTRPPAEVFSIWIIVVVVAAIGITVAATLLLRKRK